MSRFSDWFEQESGYALHRLRGKRLLKDCCGAQPLPLDKGIQEYLPGKGEMVFPLYQCALCGRYLIPMENGWYKIENLLKYRVVKLDEDCGSGINPSADGGDGSGRV